MRVVSICDTEARFLSANFSRALLKILATRRDDGIGLPVTIDLEIGPYYEMSQKEDFLRFMRKLVDIPVPPVYGS